MRTRLYILKHTHGCALALAGVLITGQVCRANAGDEPAETAAVAVAVDTGGGASASAGGGGGSSGGAVVIKAIEPAATEGQAARPDHPWLGIAIEEASEALASQLDLAPGVGLVATHVAPDSPAAAAGLEKNDVLVEFEGQSLVHPLQLRKLVQVRKEGDKVELTFYRAGKKQTVSATLGKTRPGFGALEDERGWKGDVWDFPGQFRNLPGGDAIRNQIKVYRDSLGHLKIDQSKVQEEVRRSIEQARKAWQDAVRTSTNAALSALSKALKEVQRSGLLPDNSASVTVRSTGERVQSIVKADESGTMVIVSNPKPRLTAHDKDGKLLFDGEVDTPEQRAKVPPELWEKVEPLLDKLAPKAEDEPATKPDPLKGKKSRRDTSRAPAPGSTGPTL